MDYMQLLAFEVFPILTQKLNEIGYIYSPGLYYATLHVRPYLWVLVSDSDFF